MRLLVVGVVVVGRLGVAVIVAVVELFVIALR